MQSEDERGSRAADARRSPVDVVLVLLPFFSNLPQMIHNLHSFFHSVAIWRLTKRSAFASTW